MREAQFGERGVRGAREGEGSTVAREGREKASWAGAGCGKAKWTREDAGSWGDNHNRRVASMQI